MCLLCSARRRLEDGAGGQIVEKLSLGAAASLRVKRLWPRVDRHEVEQRAGFEIWDARDIENVARLMGKFANAMSDDSQDVR
jgi:hypothetical protein